MPSKEKIEKAKQKLKETQDSYLKDELDISIEIILNYIKQLETKANKYDSLVKKLEVKIEELEKIAKKADTIPTTVKEERLDGTIVYSQRFSAEGYIAQIAMKILQELLKEAEE